MEADADSHHCGVPDDADVGEVGMREGTGIPL